MTYTESKVAEIRVKGIWCKTDAGLYDGSHHDNFLKALSIYGSPQQVKAIFGIPVSGSECYVTVENETIWIRRDYDELRFRSTGLGYGKRHGLIWTRDIGKNTIIWFSPEERLGALCLAISRRKIPFDRAWIGSIEKALLEREYITELQGRGAWVDISVTGKMMLYAAS